jgi:hypothetical protein
MSVIMRRSTDSQGGEWQEMPEGLFRWIVGAPTVKKFAGNEKPSIQFPLSLTDPEKERLKAEYGEPPEGTLQSWRPAFGGYLVGPSLGWIDKTGSYHTTKLVDLLCALFGNKNAARARKYFQEGGGPYLDAAGSEEDQIAQLTSWLAWFEGLEVLGSIKHDNGTRGLLARFGGPLPVGTPGTSWGPDQNYQTHGRGKLRMVMLQDGVSDDEDAPTAASAPTIERPAEPPEEDDDETQALAALEAARAKKAAKNQGAVATATGEAPARTYSEVFENVPA